MSLKIDVNANPYNIPLEDYQKAIEENKIKNLQIRHLKKEIKNKLQTLHQYSKLTEFANNIIEDQQNQINQKDRIINLYKHFVSDMQSCKTCHEKISHHKKNYSI